MGMVSSIYGGRRRSTGSPKKAKKQRCNRNPEYSREAIEGTGKAMQSLRQGYEATQRHASGLTNTDYKSALAAKRKAKKEYWGRQTTSIYALIDPRNQSYRYIGKSNFVDLRYGQHLDKATTNAKKKAWVDELKALGFQPQLRVLEKCALQVWKKRERYWISVYKESGLLLNLTY